MYYSEASQIISHAYVIITRVLHLLIYVNFVNFALLKMFLDFALLKYKN